MRVRAARLRDLPAVSRLAAELVRLHHRLDPQRFLLVEPIEKGYRLFFGRELERKGAVILVAEDERRSREGGRALPARARRGGQGPSQGPGQIVGYAYGTMEGRNWNDLLDACGKLNDIYVHESARRHGVGRLLLDAMRSELTARGAPRIVLLTAWGNPNAHAFFESAGFRRTMLEMTVEAGQGEAKPS